MAHRGRAGRDKRPRARAANVVVPFPRSASGDGLDLGPYVPSARSLLIAFAVLGGVLVSLVLARETSLFGVKAIEVTGASGGIERQVLRTLDDRTDESLLALDLDEARVAITALPTVESVTFDRAYPHTLRVAIVPERPVAVVRQGAAAFVVSERGRVIASAERHARPTLARIWVAKDVRLEPGGFVEGELATAVGAVAPLAGVRFPSRVVSVTTTEGLTLRLRSGLELRLGDGEHVDLKLAVASRVLPRLPVGSGYLDVSVPDRPVAGPPSLDPQVEVEAEPSTGA